MKHRLPLAAARASSERRSLTQLYSKLDTELCADHEIGTRAHFNTAGTHIVMHVRLGFPSSPPGATTTLMVAMPETLVTIPTVPFKWQPVINDGLTPFDPQWSFTGPGNFEFHHPEEGQ